MQLLGTLNFYSSITHNGIEYGIGVYKSGDDKYTINARDFFTSIGVPKGHLDNTIYKYINHLDLKQDLDYVVKAGKDPIVDKPVHIFSINSAMRIAQEIKTDYAEAAFKFFEAVLKYEHHDTFQIVSYDLLIRNPLFPMSVVAYAMSIRGYNDGQIDENSLVKLLKRDKLLTRAGRPAKNYFSQFISIDNVTYVTPYGFGYLFRKYMGFITDATLSSVIESLMYANRLAHNDFLNSERSQKDIPKPMKDEKESKPTKRKEKKA